MSAKTTGEVWELDLPANKMMVLLAMADHAAHDGRNVFPSVGLIAWKTGYSERQTQRIIHALVKDKLLVPVSTESGKTIIYRIDVSAGLKKPEYQIDLRQNVTPDKMSPPTPDILSPVEVENGHVTPDKMSPELSLSLSLPSVVIESKDQKNGAQKIAPDVPEQTHDFKANSDLRPPGAAEPPKSPDDFRLLFDAVAGQVFGITSPEELAAMDETDGASDRIGKIASWLARKNDRYSVNGSRKKTVVGFISAPAEPKHVKAFVGWYRSAKPGDLPRDISKFVEYWREWGSSRKSKARASPPEIVVGLTRAPLTEEQRAEMRRVRREAGV